MINKQIVDLRITTFLLLQSYKVLSIPVKLEELEDNLYGYTDYMSITLNNKKTEDEIYVTFPHEILHILLGHKKRFRTYLGLNATPHQHAIFNLAADYVVENLLSNLFEARGKREMYISGNKDYAKVMLALEMKYKLETWMSTERIYNILNDDNLSIQLIQCENVQLANIQIDETTSYNTTLDTMFDTDIKDEISQSVKDATYLYDKINSYRTFSGYGNYYLNEELSLVDSGLNLNRKFEKLFDFVRVNGTRNVTFSKLSKFNLVEPKSDVRLHTFYDKKFNVDVAFDTSGSIDNDILSLFYSVLKKNIHFLKGEFIQFDDGIREVINLKDINFENIKRKFTGGTNINAVFDRVTKNKTKMLFIFTDLEFSFPKKPNFNIVWLVPFKNIRARVPYGSVIEC